MEGPKIEIGANTHRLSVKPQNCGQNKIFSSKRTFLSHELYKKIGDGAVILQSPKNFQFGPIGLIQTLCNALREGGGQSICYKTLHGYLSREGVIEKRYVTQFSTSYF